MSKANSEDNMFKKTELRCFEIRVASGQSFFVNPYFLAEISPYFNTLCCSTFKESYQRCATFPDETADSMKLLFGILRVRGYKAIDIACDNVCELLRLAQKFDIQLLYVRCRDFIQLNVSVFPVKILINVLATVTNYEISSLDSTKWTIAEVLAGLNISQLTGEKWYEVRDSGLVACIIHTSMKNSEPIMTNTLHHAKVETSRESNRSNYAVDYCELCNGYRDAKCAKCSKRLCLKCMSKKCSNVFQKYRIDRSLFH